MEGGVSVAERAGSFVSAILIVTTASSREELLPVTLAESLPPNTCHTSEMCETSDDMSETSEMSEMCEMNEITHITCRVTAAKHLHNRVRCVRRLMI